MSGAYGELLLAFPEQQEQIAYFDMQAVGSRYGPPTGVQTITGAIQRIERRVKENNGNLVTVRERYLWTDAVLVSGKFIRDEDGLTYRITADSEWLREAGFTRYTVERVVGADGTDSVDADINYGAGSFA